MKETIRSLVRSKQFITLGVLVASFIGVVAGWLIADDLATPALLLALALAGVSGIAMVGMSVRSSQRLAKVERGMRHSNETRRLIRNTAGSVGRMAPLVRQIEARDRSASAARAVSPRHLPNLTIPSNRRTFKRDLCVAVILDEFSSSAFEPEWEQLPMTPANWREVLDSHPDMLFVESAWRGNDGAWLYHLVGDSAPRPALVEMVAAYRERGIPTVFWNKEDPPHFEDFLETARLFDHVFTSDSNLIPEYSTRLGHDRIQALPFAAQPRLHNPGRPGDLKRDLDVAFGGMYFRHKYPERREQMDELLRAASHFRLDIFARNANADPNYTFPKKYQKHIRKELSYPQMLSAYHAYKVFLNVNSVTNSPTMCARRIFEITASGGAVVTKETPGVRNYFDDEMLSIVDDSEHARHEIRALLRSPVYRDRKVHLAQRNVWGHHTYEHRVSTIADAVGIPHRVEAPSVTVISSTIRPERLDHLFRSVGTQEGVPVQLALLTHGFEVDGAELKRMAAEHGVHDLVVLGRDRDSSLGECLNALVDVASGSIISKMDDDDFYAPNYLRDLTLALRYSGADIAGKAATYVFSEARNATILTYASHEHRYTDFVRGCTLTGWADTFRSARFPALNRSEDSGFIKSVLADGGLIYSADRFNFVYHRARNSASHTWHTPDAEIFGSGDMAFIGNGEDQVVI